MAVTEDILRSYLRPRRVMRRLLTTGRGESRALAYVMIACLLFFVAQLPAVSRQAFLSGGEPGFAALASGTFMGSVLMAPLVLYGVAALSHLAARALGGQGGWLDARLALFWTLLMIVPPVLLRGLTEAFLGRGPETSVLSLLTGAMFVVYWAINLREAERPRPAEDTTRPGPDAAPKEEAETAHV
ncbi:hypothetical protein BV394_02460 [Brevirhabdus pacifica]|uniref:Yip1 domain-containing protein n=1 Tax=Brevirhabdus pacifica TaxID=1267768 RepID=A0A1U7DFR1_9RHOB|nr:YIP1 family protein [Brevirhabdus pacifica]APX88733.1 hypothetical protein BV394_02460 [Brevirhabdus pacifica]PJJ86747.1 hypothetical protein CLV77_1303 [Brevirhabdus pacifica]